VVIMVDIDVSVNGTTTDLIHWIQGNFSASPGSPKLSSSQGPIASYFPPGPPAGQTHRYVQMLFNEPQGFSVPADFTAIFANLTASVVNRIGFDYNKFIAESKLGDPVAGNYFRVATPNDTASATSTSTVATSGTGVRPTGSAAPTTSPTGPASSAAPANGGIVGRVLDFPVLVGLGLVGIALNVF
jgi:Phosphatidylethanolamine-binding protein